MTQLLPLDAGTLAYWNSILANRGYGTEPMTASGSPSICRVGALTS